MLKRTNNYTFADFYARDKGVIRAAVTIGLELRFVLNKWPVAIATLRKNFPTMLYSRLVYLLENIEA